MWITDNSSGGTIYAWGTGTLPIASQLQWNLQVEVTPMPIPLQNIPLLLNFGGASPSMTISWRATSTNNYTGTANGDWVQLMSNVQWGSSTQGYTLHIPEVSTVGSTLTVQGFVSQMTLTYDEGQVNTFSASLTFLPGSIV